MMITYCIDTYRIRERYLWGVTIIIHVKQFDCWYLFLKTFTPRALFPMQVSNWNKVNVSFWVVGQVVCPSEASGCKDLLPIQLYKFHPFKHSNSFLIIADWCSPSASVISQISVPYLLFFNALLKQSKL